MWLLLGGRGAGKTRAGAEWVGAQALGLWSAGAGRARRIALLGETLGDVRRVKIEGASGLLAVHPDDERPVFEALNGRIGWPDGSVAHCFRRRRRTVCGGRNALRLGVAPRVCVTMTPRASTHDNADNLAPGFVTELERRYQGSVLGRQELLGEIVVGE